MIYRPHGVADASIAEKWHLNGADAPYLGAINYMAIQGIDAVHHYSLYIGQSVAGRQWSSRQIFSSHCY